MPQARRFVPLLLILLAGACGRTDDAPPPATAAGGEPAADLVIVNGTIYTVDPDRPRASGVVVNDGRISVVGTSGEAQAYVGPETEVLDIQGFTMVPGFIESHGHLMGIGAGLMRLDLTAVTSYDELVDAVAAAVENTSPGEWILGRGWHQSMWDPPPEPMVKGFQTHDRLSAVSPLNPVFLRHRSGHASFANARAMALAGVVAGTASPPGGEVIKDAGGNPTGVFVETAGSLIARHIPESTPESSRRALDLALAHCLENGVTTFQDAGSGGDTIALFSEYADAGELPVRLWVMLRGDQALLDRWYRSGPQVGHGGGYLTVRAIKLAIDGALGSYGAWLHEPYSDKPSTKGHNTTPVERVYEVAKAGLQHGFQVCVHAIGDRGNSEVLDQFERAFAEHPDAAKGARFRVEHAQHLRAADIPRFRELGVIASMQGIHMASDRPWAIDRLGQERIDEGAYVWRKLLATGAKVINGTDAPVEPLSPIACYYASVTRRTLRGTPPGGYEPEQKMTREQALRSYTLDAAYGAFEEDSKGSIEVGKLADFAVLSQDILTVPDEVLLDTEVLFTIVGGSVRYKKH